MASRREFFRRVLGAAALPAALPVAVEILPTSAPPRIWPGSLREAKDYRGFKIFWTGWKSSLEHTMQVGQWLAWRQGTFHYGPMPGGSYARDGQFDISKRTTVILDERACYLYVSVPGMIGGRYYPYQVLNCAQRSEHLVTLATPEAVKDAYVAEGYGYIHKLADYYEHWNLDMNGVECRPLEWELDKGTVRSI